MEKNKIIYLDSQITFFEEVEDKVLSSKVKETVISVLKKTEVIYNENSGLNKEYCDEHGIKYYKGKIDSIGTGVVTAGSIVLTIKRKLLNGGEALSDRFSKELCKYLAQKGLPSVRQDNNDILVDGFKVASGGEITINNWNYMGYQISVNQDIEAIENICTKPMIKIPKALSDYGITTDEIVEFCKGYWEKE